jgi:hypothetical protein
VAYIFSISLPVASQIMVAALRACRSVIVLHSVLNIVRV